MTSKDYDLNLWERNYAEIPAVQGEAQSRTVNIHLKEEANVTDALGNLTIRQKPVDITGYSAPRLYIEKTDQTKVFFDGTIADAGNGEVSFILPYQATTAAGENSGTVYLTKPDGTILKAIGLTLNVQANDLDGSVQSADDFSALVTALNKADTAAQQTEKAKEDSETAVANANAAISSIDTKNQEITDAENARATAEQTRQSQEETRQSDESARHTAETARASAESARQTQESARQDNESDRNTAETDRATAESTREDNESARETSETARQTAESTRKNNEDARKTNEADRQDNETSRQTAETSRVSAESDRVTVEQARADAESARVDAENTRQTDTQAAISSANAAADMANHVPQYGESGNWESWNGTAYADSGKPWKGEKGDPFEYGQSYDTLADLQAAYPSGDAKGHLVGEVAYVWDGSAWKPTSVDLSAYQKTADADAKYVPQSDKGTANGIATLDESGKIQSEQLPSMDYIPTSDKGAANGVATLDESGKVPADQLNIPSPNYAGTLVVHVTSSDSGSVTGTRVRIRNEQLGANYVQSLDALGNTTFSLLDNHTYYVVLLDYPSSYYGAAATVTITGGETQALNLELKIEPDIIGWKMRQDTGVIEYTDGAIDHIPATMTDGTFDFGSWANSWLIKNIKPCLLKNGVVQYYLDSNDYTKKVDGTTSDITSGTDGNVMIEFPLMYYKFYEETDIDNVTWTGVKFSLTPQDDTWCANAFLNINGVIQETMYMAAYDGYVNNNILYSLSGKVPANNITIGNFRTYATANGSGYQQQEWTKRVFLQAIFVMLFKSTDSQTALGKGVTSASAAINTGTMNDKGLFWGDQTGTAGVKFCGIENFWGNIYKWCDGLELISLVYKYKIYGSYNDTASGYISGNTAPNESNGTWVKIMYSNNGEGLVAKTNDNSSNYYYDEFYNYSSATLFVCRTGGRWNDGVIAGLFCVYLNDTVSEAYVNIGASLSFTPV